MSIRSLPSILIEEINSYSSSSILRVYNRCNYISGRHNEDWYSVQTNCATLNNIPIFILKCVYVCVYVCVYMCVVHRRGRDP